MFAATRESPLVLVKKGWCVLCRFVLIDVLLFLSSWCQSIKSLRFVDSFEADLGVSVELSSGCGAEVFSDWVCSLTRSVVTLPLWAFHAPGLTQKASGFYDIFSWMPPLLIYNHFCNHARLNHCLRSFFFFFLIQKLNGENPNQPQTKRCLHNFILVCRYFFFLLCAGSLES